MGGVFLNAARFDGRSCINSPLPSDLCSVCEQSFLSWWRVMSAIEMIEDTDLKSGASVRHTEEGLRSSLSIDERVLARFGKRQQLRVSSQ